MRHVLDATAAALRCDGPAPRSSWRSMPATTKHPEIVGPRLVHVQTLGTSLSKLEPGSQTSASCVCSFVGEASTRCPWTRSWRNTTGGGTREDELKIQCTLLEREVLPKAVAVPIASINSDQFNHTNCLLVPVAAGAAAASLR